MNVLSEGKKEKKSCHVYMKDKGACLSLFTVYYCRLLELQKFAMIIKSRHVVLRVYLFNLPLRMTSDSQ